MFGQLLNEMFKIENLEKDIKEDKDDEQKDKEKDKDKDKEKKDKDNNLQNIKKELNIYYSDYGYIKLEESKDKSKEEQLIKFTQYKYNSIPENSLKGVIYYKNIKKEINIKIKTFFNQREIYPLEKVDIFSPLNSAVEKIFTQIKQNKDDKNNESNKHIEHITPKTQYRIFSCHKEIKELNTTLCIFENEIMDNELLLYLPTKDLSFSQYIKGYNIQISKKGKIASKLNDDAPQYVLGDLYYSFGKHYFEINLLTEPIAASVIVGVATKRNQKDKYTYDVNNFYGIILSDLKLISSERGKQIKKEYNKKESFGINDIVGVMLDFKKDGLDVYFYKNKICLGLAYSKLNKDNLYYPAVSLGIVGSKVQISNQIEFP